MEGRGRLPEIMVALRSPTQFKDIFTAVAAVDRTCQMRIASDLITLFSSRNHGALQIWVYLAKDYAFQSIQAYPNEDTFMELRADLLPQAFRSYNGVDDVVLRIDNKGNAMKRLRIRTASIDLEGNEMVSVKQVLYARSLEPEELLEEPRVDGREKFAEPSRKQLRQIFGVSDKYSQMNGKIRISLSDSGILTILAENQFVRASASWTVTMPELIDEQTTTEHRPAFSQESNQSQSETNQNSPCSCTVPAKDWCNTFTSIHVFRRFIIGVVDSRAVVVHAYLRGDDDNMVSYYLPQSAAAS